MKKLSVTLSSVSWFTVLLVGGLLHIALTPVESKSVGAGLPLALFVRLGAWIFIAAIAYFSTRNFFKIKLKLFIFLGTIFLVYFISNLMAGLFPALMFVMLATGMFGALIIDSACRSSQKFRNSFVHSLNVLIVFWVVAFLFQNLWFYTTGNILQVHNYFAPLSLEEQRTDLLTSGLARLGGAHIEPGTYVNWLFGVVLIKAFYQKKLFGLIGTFSLLMMPVSMSFWGVIAFFFSLFSFLIISNKSPAFYLKALLCLSCVMYALVQFDILPVAYEYFEFRSQGEDESTEAKVDGYAGFFRNIFSYLFFGAGVDYDFCSGCLSPQDSGVFVNLAVQLGVVGAVVCFVVVFFGYYKFFGLPGVVLLIPVLIAKWYYWDPVFLMLMTTGVSAAIMKRANREQKLLS